MTRKAIAQGWMTGTLVLAALAAIAVTSFSQRGLQLQTGGVEMTVKASMEQGVQIYFVAPE
ncbi:MAG: hypothetical protein AAGB16_08945 [Pseudomonadota bacterium]